MLLREPQCNALQTVRMRVCRAVPHVVPTTGLALGVGNTLCWRQSAVRRTSLREVR